MRHCASDCVDRYGNVYTACLVRHLQCVLGVPGASSLANVPSSSSNYIDWSKHWGRLVAIVVSLNRRIDSSNLIALGIAGLRIHFLKSRIIGMFSPNPALIKGVPQDNLEILGKVPTGGGGVKPKTKLS